MLGFAIFLIGLVVWIVAGSLAPLNIGLALGAFPWSVGAIQLARRLMLPLQARTWAHREQPLPWIFRPSWMDIVAAAAAACAIAIAASGPGSALLTVKWMAVSQARAAADAGSREAAPVSVMLRAGSTNDRPGRWSPWRRTRCVCFLRRRA